MVLVVAVVGSHSGHSSRSGIDGHGSYDGGSSRMKVATTFATISIASTDATTITHPNPTQPNKATTTTTAGINKAGVPDG